jgi:hypothetical protein
MTDTTFSRASKENINTEKAQKAIFIHIYGHTSKKWTIIPIDE